MIATQEGEDNVIVIYPRQKRVDPMVVKVGTCSQSRKATSDSLMRDPDWRASGMMDLVEYR